ncbi:MAG: permease [Candidatus Eisenbacteria bacterium]|nr:permease [Candidatus Eisenbacteria bacterium]
MKSDARLIIIILAVFLIFYFVPIENGRLGNAVMESLMLVQWYVREHVLLGLLPAFFIAGAISAFVSKASVMRYLGAHASKFVSYAVASVSGSILAVCSCTILPLFAGIYSRGAGLGPATTFLYAGPAINVLAIFLTARVLGAELGVARAIGAIAFSIVIGLLMHLFFRREERARAEQALSGPRPEADRPIGQSLSMFVVTVAVLAFANWHADGGSGVSRAIAQIKWPLTGAFAALLGALLIVWFRASVWIVAGTGAAVVAATLLVPGNPVVPFLVGIAGLATATALGKGEMREWLDSTWGLAKDILPLLFAGVLVVGALLGRPGHDGLIPSSWIAALVGDNSILSSFVAAVASGLMYFCTMTEIPIVQGLMGAGMAKGPALAFLLAGPAVSLPNILILTRIVGTRKTTVYLALVLVMSTITGTVFGFLVD